MNDITPSCCGEVVKNTAGGKDFYFCRGCKQEPGDSGVPLAALMLDTLNHVKKAMGNLQYHPQIVIPHNQCPHSHVINNFCNACGVNVPAPGLPTCLHPTSKRSLVSSKLECIYCGATVPEPQYCTHPNKVIDIANDLERCPDCGLSWQY